MTTVKLLTMQDNKPARHLFSHLLAQLSELTSNACKEFLHSFSIFLLFLSNSVLKLSSILKSLFQSHSILLAVFSPTLLLLSVFFLFFSSLRCTVFTVFTVLGAEYSWCTVHQITVHMCLQSSHCILSAASGACSHIVHSVNKCLVLTVDSVDSCVHSAD